jgi:copper oxidase (laccase) domain-containing protein
LEIVYLKQIHSPIILPATKNNLEAEGDGLLNYGLPFAIKTADCLPILILGKNGQALLHAGWRGLFNKIISQPQIKGINPYYAFIGPAISHEHYEVQNDFLKNFDDFIHKDGKTYFDLKLEASKQLKKNYPSIEVEDCGICTFSNERLNSYRRDKNQQRNWNLFIPN